MSKCIRCLLLSTAVVLCSLMAGVAQELKGPAKEAVDLAGQAESGKDIAESIKKFRERFGGVRAAMNVFNPRQRGGIGFGTKGISIEGKLINLEKKELAADQLKSESAELTRVAHVAVIMADVFRDLAPSKEFLGRGKKEWVEDTDAMKAGSQSLLKALKAGDPKAVKEAATKINNACNRCHDGKK